MSLKPILKLISATTKNTIDNTERVLRQKSARTHQKSEMQKNNIGIQNECELLHKREKEKEKYIKS